jgi:hypothetical protein
MTSAQTLSSVRVLELVIANVISSNLPNRSGVCISTNPKFWEISPDCVRYIRGGEVGVVTFGHPRISMPELGRDDSHGDAAHRQHGTVSVPQNMKCSRWIQLGPLGRLRDGSQLV